MSHNEWHLTLGVKVFRSHSGAARYAKKLGKEHTGKHFDAHAIGKNAFAAYLIPEQGEPMPCPKALH